MVLLGVVNLYYRYTYIALFGKWYKIGEFPRKLIASSKHDISSNISGDRGMEIIYNWSLIIKAIWRVLLILSRTRRCFLILKNLGSFFMLNNCALQASMIKYQVLKYLLISDNQHVGAFILFNINSKLMLIIRISILHAHLHTL